MTPLGFELGCGNSRSLPLCTLVLTYRDALLTASTLDTLTTPFLLSLGLVVALLPLTGRGLSVQPTVFYNSLKSSSGEFMPKVELLLLQTL